MFARSVRAEQGEEGKDVFAPAADLMVGVVFIFIILMLALVMNLQREDTVAKSEYDQQVARVQSLETENLQLTGRLEREIGLRVAAEVREQTLSQANTRLLTFVKFVRDSGAMRVMSSLASANQTRSDLLEEMRSRLAAASINVMVNTGL